MMLMMRIKIITISLICLVFASCNDANLKNAEIVIPIQTSKVSNYQDVFARQEILELPNDKDACMAKIDRTQVYDDYFVFRDNKDIIYVFDKNGTLISNSKSVHGKGNGEYYICLAYSYNKYNHNIEIVVPDGIMFYDMNFHFINKVKYNDKKLESCMFNHIYDLGNYRHLLLCPLEDDRGSKYYVYDSKQQKMILSKDYPIECKNITMQEQCVSDDNFIAFPCLNYSFYELNAEDYGYKGLVTFDFGDKKFNTEGYEGNKSADRIREDLLRSTKAMPLRTFKSGDIIATLIKEGPKREDYKTALINIKTKKYAVLQNVAEKHAFPMMDYFKNGIIYACVSADELDTYVIEGLLDSKSKDIYAKRSVDSNYYILKYYLKQ